MPSATARRRRTRTCPDGSAALFRNDLCSVPDILNPLHYEGTQYQCLRLDSRGEPAMANDNKDPFDLWSCRWQKSNCAPKRKKLRQARFPEPAGADDGLKILTG